MAEKRWSGHSADVYETSDGRQFDSQREADAHQDREDEWERWKASSGISRTPDYWMNETGKKADAYTDEGRYDDAIAFCDKALKDYNYENFNKDNIIGYVFAVRGRAYDHKGMREKAIEDFKEAAGYGSSGAKEVLGRYGVAYTPKRPSTYFSYHPSHREYYSSPQAESPVISGKDVWRFGLSAVPGIMCGIGLMFTAGWVYLQVTGAERLERIPALVVLAVATLVTALFIHLKKWIVVILLAILAVAGYLILFGVIPEHLSP